MASNTTSPPSPFTKCAQPSSPTPVLYIKTTTQYLLLGCALYALGLSTLCAAVPPPAGPEFIVNATLPGGQTSPDVGCDSAGNFVVSWEGRGAGNVDGILARRYTLPDLAGGSEFFVTTGGSSPVMAMNSGGSFVVAWRNYERAPGTTTQYYTIRGQKYDPLGNPTEPSRSYTPDTRNASTPSIAMNQTGVISAAWAGYISGSTQSFRRYDVLGGLRGSGSTLHSNVESNQFAPSVAISKSEKENNFAVWESTNQDGSGSGIYGQRHVSGSEFRVNSTTVGYQGNPSVSMDQSGNFVVVWECSTLDGSGTGIVGQRYSANKTPQGGEFVVNTYKTGNQTNPSVDMNSAGEFVVVWESSGQDGDGQGIFARRFLANGVARDVADFQINSSTAGNQTGPKIAMDDTGAFVAVWESIQSTSSSDIFARRFLKDSVVPTVSSTLVNVTGTTATLRGDVSNDGGSAITAAGIVYCESSMNTNPRIGGVGVVNISLPNGTGGTSKVVTGLNPGTSYSFAAYATNYAGTTYGATLRFTTLSNNAFLSGLTIGGGILSPSFTPAVFNYSSTVSYNIGSVTVTALPAEASARFTVNGISVPVGQQSATVSLAVGLNILNTIVTAADGVTTRTYTHNVVRQDRLDSWRQLHFPGSTVTSGPGANAATPQNDGIANLIKFGLGMDPTKPGVLPVIFLMDGSSLTFSYTPSVDALAAGFKFTVEYMDDLSSGNWASDIIDQGNAGSGGSPVTVTVPPGPSGRRFVHLKVEPPSE